MMVDECNLRSCLELVFSAEQTKRTWAESHLKKLQSSAGFGVQLCDVIGEVSAPLAMRQLACVLMKQYVQVHWSEDGGKHEPPVVDSQNKELIRSRLLGYLPESISKIRSLVAYAIAAIAHFDWPREWPELMNFCIQALGSGDPNLVHGVCRMLVEFVTEITDQQITVIAPRLLPCLLGVFLDAEKFSIRTRSRIVSIFNTITGLIGFMKEVDKRARNLLLPVLPQFLEAFSASLQDSNGFACDDGLRLEIVKALTTLLEKFPKQVSKYLPQILPYLWNLMLTTVSRFTSSSIYAADEDGVEGAVDSDGEKIDIDGLVSVMIDFLQALLAHPKMAKEHLLPALGQLFSLLLHYSQITEQKVVEWSENPSAFAEEEDEEGVTFTVRTNALDFILAVAVDYETKTAESLGSAVGQLLEESQKLRADGNPHWWKLREVCWLACGSLSQLVNQYASFGVFDIPALVRDYVIPDLAIDGLPFLSGQALWFVSRVADCLTKPDVHQLLELNVNALQPGSHDVLRVLALKSLTNFCDYATEFELVPVIDANAERLVVPLVQMATQAVEYVLSVLLNCLNSLVGLSSKLCIDHEKRIVPLSIACMLKYSGDPTVPMIVSEIIKSMSETPAIQAQVEERVVPTCISILKTSPEKLPIRLKAVCLEVIESIVRSHSPRPSSSSPTAPTPLSTRLGQEAYPLVVETIVQSDDLSILSEGSSCVRAFMSVGGEPLLTHVFPDGASGLDMALRVLEHLLNPASPSNSLLGLNRFVVVLLKYGVPLGGVQLEPILRVVFAKLQLVSVLCDIQSLLLIYGSLIVHNHLTPVVDLLSSLVTTNGESGLLYVMRVWCENHSCFMPDFESNLSTYALMKILEHGATTEDPRFQAINFQEPVESPRGKGARMKTRQAKKLAKPLKQDINILVKILKLLVLDIGGIVERLQAGTGDSDEDDDDDDDEEDGTVNEDETVLEEHAVPSGEGGDVPHAMVDSGVSSATAGELLLADSLAKVIADAVDDQISENDVEEDDPDLVGDPVLGLNLETTLREFINQMLLNNPNFTKLMTFLTENERKTVGLLVNKV